MALLCPLALPSSKAVCGLDREGGNLQSLSPDTCFSLAGKLMRNGFFLLLRISLFSAAFQTQPWSMNRAQSHARCLQCCGTQSSDYRVSRVTSEPLLLPPTWLSSFLPDPLSQYSFLSWSPLSASLFLSLPFLSPPALTSHVPVSLHFSHLLLLSAGGNQTRLYSSVSLGECPLLSATTLHPLITLAIILYYVPCPDHSSDVCLLLHVR